MKQLSLGDLGIGAKRRCGKQKTKPADAVNHNENQRRRSNRQKQRVESEASDVLEVESDKSSGESEHKIARRGRKRNKRQSGVHSGKKEIDSETGSDSTVTVEGSSSAEEESDVHATSVDLIEAKRNAELANRVYNYREFKEDYYPVTLMQHAVHVTQRDESADKSSTSNRQFAFQLRDVDEFSFVPSGTLLVRLAELHDKDELAPVDDDKSQVQQEMVVNSAEWDSWLNELQSEADSDGKSAMNVRELYDSFKRKRDAQAASRATAGVMWTDLYAPVTFDEFAQLTDDAASLRHSLFDWTSAWTKNGLVKRHNEFEAASTPRRSARLTQQSVTTTCDDVRTALEPEVLDADGQDSATDVNEVQAVEVIDSESEAAPAVSEKRALRRVAFLGSETPRRSSRTRTRRAQQSVPTIWYDDEAACEIETASESGSSDSAAEVQRNVSDEEWTADSRRAPKGRAGKRRFRRRVMDNCRLLVGAFGGGKTALVYALAAQLRFIVIELSADSERSGRAIQQSLNEATQSQRVFTVATSAASLGNQLQSDASCFGYAVRASRKRLRSLSEPKQSDARHCSNSKRGRARLVQTSRTDDMPSLRKRRRIASSSSEDNDSCQLQRTSSNRSGNAAIPISIDSPASARQSRRTRKYVRLDEVHIETSQDESSSSSSPDQSQSGDDQPVPKKRGRPPKRTNSVPPPAVSSARLPASTPQQDTLPRKANRPATATLDSFWKPKLSAQPELHSKHSCGDSKDLGKRSASRDNSSAKRDGSKSGASSKGKTSSDASLLSYFKTDENCSNSKNANSAKRETGSRKGVKTPVKKQADTSSSKSPSKTCASAPSNEPTEGDKSAPVAPVVPPSGTLILFEEVDVVFDELDRGFWLAVEQLVRDAKRPIVLCTDQSAFSGPRCAPLVELIDKFQIHPTTVRLHPEHDRTRRQKLGSNLVHCMTLFEKVSGLQSLDKSMGNESPLTQLCTSRGVASCLRLLEHVRLHDSALDYLAGRFDECVIDECLELAAVRERHITSSASPPQRRTVLRQLAKFAANCSLANCVALRHAHSTAAAIRCFAASLAVRPFANELKTRTAPAPALRTVQHKCLQREQALACCALPIDSSVFALHKSNLHADYVPFLREMLLTETRSCAMERPLRTRLNWTQSEWKCIRETVLYDSLDTVSST